MDFHLKQWKNQHESEDEQQLQLPFAKQPRLLLDPHLYPYQQQEQESSSAFALPLFVPETTSNKLSSLSDSTTVEPTATTRFPKGMGSNYFSLAQWQELELQTLIFRHMTAGAAVPPQLLHLVKKSLLNSPSPSPPYYLPHPLQHYHHHYQPSLVPTGYWGRAAMDPEPGRCRRTDGKKWRCSRDVVVGQKYCERHMHRGRNRSRKPVEIPATQTSPAAASATVTSGGGLKTHGGSLAAPVARPFAPAAVAGRGSGATHFDFADPSPSIDLLHLNQRDSERMNDNKPPMDSEHAVSGNGKSSGQILRHFFDDWPRTLEDDDNAGNNNSSITSATTSLSISMPGNSSSDFSLKLSTGSDAYNSGHQDGSTGSNMERVTWGTNQVASVGGPLAEALRSSSTSNSSPTSVLHHHLRRGSVSEASYIST